MCQTRQLKTKIFKHQNHINKSTKIQSVITEHRLQFNHEFDWVDVKILKVWGLISEMMFIKKQNNVLNLQSDMKYLHRAYVS